jgi:hypothetical protein
VMLAKRAGVDFTADELFFGFQRRFPAFL